MSSIHSHERSKTFENPVQKSRHNSNYFIKQNNYRKTQESQKTAIFGFSKKLIVISTRLNPSIRFCFFSKHNKIKFSILWWPIDSHCGVLIFITTEKLGSQNAVLHLNIRPATNMLRVSRNVTLCLHINENASKLVCASILCSRKITKMSFLMAFRCLKFLDTSISWDPCRLPHLLEKRWSR